MALSTTETKVATAASVGSIAIGTVALIGGMASGNHAFAVGSTSAYGVGVAALVATQLYDQAGQKMVVWQSLRASAKAVGLSTASEVETLAAKLQRLEHSIDHRIDVISDSASAKGQTAMGAWVHAAKNVLAKAAMFDTAASPVDTEPGKLSSHWPKVAQQLASRKVAYERMLRIDPANPVSDTIINYDYPSQ